MPVHQPVIVCLRSNYSFFTPKSVKKGSHMQHLLYKLSLYFSVFFCIFISCFLLINPAIAKTQQKKLHFDSFQQYVDLALHGKALENFKEVTKDVKNNIFWKGKARRNKYQSAYKRSLPYLQTLLKNDIPDFIFLIPYLESGWRPNRGRKNSDYGYWQMVSEVVAEIKTLDHASKALKTSDANTIRSDPKLSTEAALIHIKRYYFYFRHVANFAESDAWLFSVIAYNWGAGNVKRALIKMQTEGVVKDETDLSFASFYHYLFKSSLATPEDRSMRVALEYLPNLWNIALLIQGKNS